MCKDCGCCYLTSVVCRLLGYMCLTKCYRCGRTANVCGSQIKKSELPAIFNELPGKQKSVRQISSRILSEVGNLAILAAVRVDWNDGSSDEYVLKTIDYNRTGLMISINPRRADVAPIMRQFMTDCQNSESAAYEFLRHHGHIKVPKIYFTRQASDVKPGMIIMENLSQRAKSESVWRGLDLQQVLSVVEALARIHIVCLKDQSWLTGVPDDNGVSRIFLIVYGGMVPMFSFVKGAFREFSQFDEKKVKEFFSTEKYLQKLYCHRGKLPDVLVHGDMLINNVMFEVQPDGKVGSEVGAIIDWQLTRAGNPLDDIAKVLGWGAHLDVFEHHQDTVLQRYFAVMTAEVPDVFQISYEELKTIFLDTLAAHCLVVPAITALCYKFPQKIDARKSTNQEKASNIRKAALAYDFAYGRLFQAS